MSNPVGLIYSQATDEELAAIIALQEANLRDSNSIEEVDREGFVTVVHSYELLNRMNSPYPHIICKEYGELVGYALIMLPELRNDIEVLKPMFEKIDVHHLSTNWKGKYFVMGQICIAKSHRKRGVFKGLYNYMSKVMKPFSDKVITEVSTNNQRSLNAHLHSGFNIMLEYNTPTEQWVIIERLL
jgi:hypothetical protein